MSVAFAVRGNRPPLSPAQIQKMLDENVHLIQTIQEYQAKGQLLECHQYQQVLHRNLVYLASVADANQNIQNLLPPPQQLAQGNVSQAPPTNAPSSGVDVPGGSQQQYRPPPGVSTTPTRPTQSYGQRPYPQNQYQGQYQGAPGVYSPQGGYGPTNQGYGPPNPSQQPQVYPPNSNYGPPITTTPSNYAASTHPGSGYPPSSVQQPYVPPPGSPASAGNPYPIRGSSQPIYTGNSAYQSSQSGGNYPNVGVSTYNSTPPQPQPYQSQSFSNTTPTSAYGSTPTSQPNRSPQPPSGYTQQNPTSSGYGSPSAQSPTYNSSSLNSSAPPSTVASGPPVSGPQGQQYVPPTQPSPYTPVTQPPYSNPSSQPGSPAPSVSTAPPPQTSYAQNPQNYPPAGGAYPPHAYQQGYPPSQYPPSPYPYARAPAPGAPPPVTPQSYPGYGFQPPAQQ